jgi:hypothetical protein
MAAFTIILDDAGNIRWDGDLSVLMVPTVLRMVAARVERTAVEQRAPLEPIAPLEMEESPNGRE